MSKTDINPGKFYAHLEHLISDWTTNRSRWGDSDSLCIPMGTGQDTKYSKSAAIHMYLFGYEFLDSIILLTRNHFYFLANSKKCDRLQHLVGQSEKFGFTLIQKEKFEAHERFQLLHDAIRNAGIKFGSLFKAKFEGALISSWLQFVDENNFEKVDIQLPLSMFFSMKDATDLETCKKAAILSNKVFKHGFMNKLEDILDKKLSITHENLSEEVENIIDDPKRINVNIPEGLAESCYTPIIMSSGNYDIKPSAMSDNQPLGGNIVICSLGARYKGYCANIARTIFVDPPKKAEDKYGLLVRMQEKCLEAMVVGKPFSAVYEAAKNFLTSSSPDLLPLLPKNLGSSIGLEFRDSALLLSENNRSLFREGMVFNLSLGFQNIPLSSSDKTGSSEAYRSMNTFSLLLSDTVAIQSVGTPQVLTLYPIEFEKNFLSLDSNEEEEEGDEEEGKSDSRGKSRSDKADQDLTANMARRSTRTAEEVESNERSIAEKQEKQRSVLMKSLEEGKRRMAAGGGVTNLGDEDEGMTEFKDSYSSAEEFPKELQHNQIRMDSDREVLIVPINGQPVPFHVSTIKSISLPDPDRATFMRINFFNPGTSLGKEVAKPMQFLVQTQGGKFPFIKELTFKSKNSRNLIDANNAFLAVRKRIRDRLKQEEMLKDIVEQGKLIKLKDQRVPRLMDVTMRPQLSGRKCVGTIEAHQNGLRFISNKGETLDVMYQNVKSSIFQPCKPSMGSGLVLIHFHLKDPIVIGKKKFNDIQFYTEAVEASLNLDGYRRNSRDPDDIEDEQREREQRKKLNMAYWDFGLKLQKIAAHYNYSLTVDPPLKVPPFQGNTAKETVTFIATINSLVNLSETPPFVVTLSDVEHVHFERMTFATRTFDMTFVFKNWDTPPKTITQIDIKSKDNIQEWLTSLAEIPFSAGPKTLHWPTIIGYAKAQGEYFYLDRDEDGAKKPPGWMFVGVDDDYSESEGEDQEEQEDDSAYDSSENESEDGSEGSDDDDDSLDSEEDEDSDADSEEGSEEEDSEDDGADWDTLEARAKADDKRRATEEAQRERDDRSGRDSSKRPKTSNSSNSRGGGGGGGGGGKGGGGGGVKRR